MQDQRLLGNGEKKTPRQRLGAFVRYRVLYPARYRSDLRQARARAASGGPRVRTLALVSDHLAYCSDEQMYPFRHYRDSLRDDHGVVTQEFRLDDVAANGFRALRRFDYVGFKLTYRTDRDEAIRTVAKLRSALGPDKTILYLDGDDDSCVQWPEILKDVDLYLKKHVFSDRNDYTKTYLGKSNLHDYAVREFGHVLSPLDYGDAGNVPLVIESAGPVPQEQIGKIHTSWNIGLDRKIIDLYQSLRATPYSHDREFDLAFRGSVKRETFTYYLRRDVEDRLRPLEERYKLLIGSKRVSQEEYYQEMRNSRICVSPFGFGEICWRDFETVLCGALLIKPDMSHVETAPNIFVANETYVPVKWDFSDLESVVARVLNNEAERRRIVDNAYNALSRYYENGAFAKTVDRLLT